MNLRSCCLRLLAVSAFVVFGVAVPAHSQSATESVVYAFCSQSNCADGKLPYAGLTQGTDGNLYGMTTNGGAHQKGTVFELTSLGAFKTLYSFCSLTNCTDGTDPLYNLVEYNEFFYGTTPYGGANAAGTIFKINSSGALTMLYQFCNLANCTDGENPVGTLVSDGEGNFYGATTAGGADGKGTAFKLSSTGSLTTLYSFCSAGGSLCTDGKYPNGLLLGSDKNFYGTTQSGGSEGTGTIFRMPSAGVTLSTLYNFCNAGGSCADGEDPFAALVEDANGDFYGVTAAGGPANDAGTVFKLNSLETFSTLYAFCDTSCSTGSTPYDYAGLTVGTNGSYYGVTSLDGANNGGTLFSITPAGTLTNIYNFCSEGATDCTDGAEPVSAPILGKDGNWYGTAISGGANTGGVIYKVVTNTGTATTTTLSASPNPATIGQAVTLTATVSGGTETPTGSVTFTVGGQYVGSGALNSGVAVATVSSSTVAAGTYQVVATYSGSSSYKTSSSSPLNVVLGPATTSTTLSALPASVTPPASVTLTATVTRTTSGSAGEPSGTVTFYYQTIALGTANLNSSGVATLTKSSNGIGAGQYPVMAKYNGDAGDTSSTSSPVTITVQ